MEIILKKPLWLTVITTLCLVAVTLFAAISCDKEKIPSNYTINFVGDEVDIKPQSIAYGNYAAEPENPEREGYSFGGWFTDNGTFANGWDFKTCIVTQDTTLYAKWEQNYPINIPFIGYSLTGTSCKWTNLAYDNTLIIINSMEELHQYVTCMGDSYPELDFSKHTLLLVHGLASSFFNDIIINSLQQLSEQSYKMEVEVVPGFATVMTKWQLPIIVNKLSEGCTIELVLIR